MFMFFFLVFFNCLHFKMLSVAFYRDNKSITNKMREKQEVVTITRTLISC